MIYMQILAARPCSKFLYSSFIWQGPPTKNGAPFGGAASKFHILKILSTNLLSRLETHILVYAARRLFGQLCFFREHLPLLNARAYLLYYVFAALAGYFHRPAGWQQIFFREVFKFAVHAHLVPAKPKVARFVCKCYIVRWRETPFAISVHKEGNVFNMVVVIVRYDIKHHTPIELFDLPFRQV